MGVYFEPRRPGWMDYVAPVVNDLLGGVVQGMFDRDRQARELKNTQRLENEKEARRRQQQTETLALLDGLGYNFRDPVAGARDAVRLKALGISTDDVLKTYAPPMEFKSIEAGDRTFGGAFDTVTGNYSPQIYQHGINPTTKYSEDADTARNKARVGAEYADIAQRQREKGADVFPEIDSETGERVMINKLTGEVRHSGIKPPQKTALDTMTPKELIDLRGQYVNRFSGDTLPGYEEMIQHIDTILAEKVAGAKGRVPGQTAKDQKELTFDPGTGTFQ